MTNIREIYLGTPNDALPNQVILPKLKMNRTRHLVVTSSAREMFGNWDQKVGPAPAKAETY